MMLRTTTHHPYTKNICFSSRAMKYSGYIFFMHSYSAVALLRVMYVIREARDLLSFFTVHCACIHHVYIDILI